MPDGFSSKHVYRIMTSKLKILRNTIDIIEEGLTAVKYASSYVFTTVLASQLNDQVDEEGLML